MIVDRIGHGSELYQMPDGDPAGDEKDMSKRKPTKYVVRNPDEKGDPEVTADASTFDAMLSKLLESGPIPSKRAKLYRRSDSLEE